MKILKYFIFMILICISINGLLAQNIGIDNTTNPQAKLDVNGALKIANNENSPVAGMVRWNEVQGDFEGYNGQGWVSLTRSSSLPFGPGITRKTAEDQLIFDEVGSSGDRFGQSVAVDSNYAVVGSPYANSLTGRIVIYKRINGYWERDTLIDGPSGLSAQFGHDVDIYDNRIVVGAPASAGKVHIYKRVGTQWELETSFDGALVQWIAGFGTAVSLSNEHLIVGAPESTPPNEPSQSGAAFLYTLSNGSWNSNPFTIYNFDSNIDSRYGFSVDLYNHNLIIGEPGKSGVNNKEGTAHIYTKANGTWSFVTSLVPNGTEENDELGRSVAISDTKAAIGVPYDKTNINGFRTGKVLVYDKENGNWQLDQAIFSDNPINSGNFGSSVDMDENFLVIGGTGQETFGRAYLYDLSSASFIVNLLEIEPSNLTFGNSFGQSVEIDESTMIVGADFATPSVPGQGAAYILKRN